MKVVRNTVEGVRRIITTMVRSVFAAVRYYESPTNKRDKERLTRLQLREEQDRIIRLIEGKNPDCLAS